MKQRITYVQPEGTGIDPNAIHVNPDSLVFSNSHNAALEKRVTVGLKELPDEVIMESMIIPIEMTADESVGHCCTERLP